MKRILSIILLAAVLCACAGERDLSQPDAGPEESAQSESAPSSAQLSRRERSGSESSEARSRVEIPSAYYELSRVDLSLPPLEREWTYEDVGLDITERDYSGRPTDNVLLWMLRDEDWREKARETVMGEITWDTVQGIRIATINFLGDWTPDEQYLFNLFHNLSGYAFVVLQNGEPLNLPQPQRDGIYYYKPLSLGGKGFYTLADVLELQDHILLDVQEQARQPKVHAEGITEDAVDLLLGDSDPVQQELARFVSRVMPPYYTLLDYTDMDFTGPQNAPDILLTLCGVYNTPNLYHMTRDEPWLHDSNTEKIHEVLAESETAFRPSDMLFMIYQGAESNGWPVVLVEKTARHFFGENIQMDHTDYGPKRFYYSPAEAVYAHFPGGTGGDFAYFPILSYQDTGDRYVVNIAIVYAGDPDGLANGAIFTSPVHAEAESLEWEEFVDYARTRAPRARLVVDKNGGANWIFHAYTYMGHR